MNDIGEQAPRDGRDSHHGSHGRERAVGGVEVVGLVKRYGRRESRPVLDDVTFNVVAGSFTCLLGPSGSGKSTLLGCVAGLIEPDAGTVAIGGRSMDRVPPHRRPTTLLMQSAQLFPFLSVAENVAFGLRVRGWAAPKQRRRVEELLALVDLEGFGDRSPAGLSGGEEQRVALARALAVEPEVMLLDEPLASLDPPVRRALQRALMELHQRLGTTMVLVTHDVDEALALAEQLLVLDGGRIVAADRPELLYQRPPTRAVARMLGIETALEGTLRNGVLEGRWGSLPVLAENARGPLMGGRTSIWVIRPEHVDISLAETATEAASAPGCLSAVLDAVRYGGATIELSLLTADGTRLAATVAAGSAAPLWSPGRPVIARLPADALIEVTGA